MKETMIKWTFAAGATASLIVGLGVMIGLQDNSPSLRTTSVASAQTQGHELAGIFGKR
ncbi:MAG: hypothetical protein ABI824_18195 [Acidobacteriota bacterium]